MRLDEVSESPILSLIDQIFRLRAGGKRFSPYTLVSQISRRRSGFATPPIER